MNVSKRLDKLESQLSGDHNTIENIMVIGFVKPGEVDARITHLWSRSGLDDCYLMDGETDDEFRNRAAKYIRELNHKDEKHALMMFGDCEVMQVLV